MNNKQYLLVPTKVEAHFQHHFLRYSNPRLSVFACIRVAHYLFLKNKKKIKLKNFVRKIMHYFYEK